ncbi:hypothetical protein [Commensalibacter nepenthis]|uniref:Uncharacterized protein n=1 Tax=Commensalibacter nepenthis TaxID=3043872 RepID=A0ABT6Q814_9PROT|nr:hypothetical protein [Commensalibacter sp. TBRC 10068]MDI2113042.1 hypothetical protein [Commensalibacter sp. TBRC 10068]
MHLSCKKILTLIPDFLQQRREANELKIKELEDQIKYRNRHADIYNQRHPKHAKECRQIAQKLQWKLDKLANNNTWRMSHGK